MTCRMLITAAVILLLNTGNVSAQHSSTAELLDSWQRLGLSLDTNAAAFFQYVDLNPCIPSRRNSNGISYRLRLTTNSWQNMSQDEKEQLMLEFQKKKMLTPLPKALENVPQMLNIGGALELIRSFIE